MATHSSILAWKFPRTEEPSGLLSMGLQRFRHDLATEQSTKRKKKKKKEKKRKKEKASLNHLKRE